MNPIAYRHHQSGTAGGRWARAVTCQSRGAFPREAEQGTLIGCRTSIRSTGSSRRRRSSTPLALAEIRRGAKRSHWMWFIFPQFAGLGQGSTARHFAIPSLDEAGAYFAHPILGLPLCRMRRCAAGSDDQRLPGALSSQVDRRADRNVFASDGGWRRHCCCVRSGC